MIVKPLGEEITLSTTPDTVSDSMLVRIYAANASTITVKNPSDSSTVGSFTMPSGSVEYVEKMKTHTLEASVDVQCVPVSYKS